MRTVPRRCAACGVDRPDKPAPDPCLGMLEGVAFACCGHGFDRMSYVALEGVDYDHRTNDCPRGELARIVLRSLGGTPPEPIDREPRVRSTAEMWPPVERSA